MSLTYQTNRENCINGLEFKKKNAELSSIVTFENECLNYFRLNFGMGFDRLSKTL